MARPKPTIILEHTDNQTYRSEQVLKATAVYSVFYKGEAINLRALIRWSIFLVQNTRKYRFLTQDTQSI